MRHLASESGKSKRQFYTPSEVSRAMASVAGSDCGTKVQQDGAVLTLEFGDGSKAQIKLEAATSSVMVRDVAGKLEYVD